MADPFSEYYKDFLENTYDCVDRLVLNAYFQMGQGGGGLRTWWRQLEGTDATLDDTHLMRFAGRFSRRIQAFAKKNRIPLIFGEAGERKQDLAAPHMPQDPAFRGIFCILVGRSPAPLWQVHRYPKGDLHLKRKEPYSWVNQYFFHIMDPDWGHMIIKLCPHPPFNAQVILNGHEYVARRAQKEGINFHKEGNCFTQISNVAGLASVAETMSTASAVGRLVEACDRWIYSACLCFALDLDEQKRSGFRYEYSVYQAEYSRNLLFQRGRQLEEVFQGTIDRTRRALHLRKVATLFGYKQRPYKRKIQQQSDRFGVVIERPAYDLTVFKIHFGKLTLKIYSKGERVLRIEAIAHNTVDLRCGRVIERFPQIVEALQAMVERFLGVLKGVDLSFIDDQKVETWPLPSQRGVARVAGLDINRPRTRNVMEALIALSVQPGGFQLSDVVERVHEIRDRRSADTYWPRHAAYDLRKFRGKALVEKIPHSRRYQVPLEGLRAMVAYLALREKVLKPLLANAGQVKPGPAVAAPADVHYRAIQHEMRNLFETIGIAA